MNRKSGYLLLETSISVCIMVIIISGLYTLMFLGIKFYNNIHSSIEIQQQGLEVQRTIEKELKNRVNVYNVKTENNEIITSNNFDYKKVISIKYKPVDREDKLGLDELFLNKRTQKVFIKRRNASSGYEIGDYIDNMYISKDKDGKIINIKLDLSKSNQKYSTSFKIYNNDLDTGEII